MWILQIRSNSDDLDLIETCNSLEISSELKATYFDIWASLSNCCSEVESGRFTLIREDGVIAAQLWLEAY